MTHGKYLDQLESRLSGLQKDAVREIIADIYAHFEAGWEAGKDDEEIIRMLGDPAALAQEYISQSDASQMEPPHAEKPHSQSYTRDYKWNEPYVFDQSFDFEPQMKLSIDLSSVRLEIMPHDGEKVDIHFEGTRSFDGIENRPRIEAERVGDAVLVREIHPKASGGWFLSPIFGMFVSKLRGVLTIGVPKQIGDLLVSHASGDTSLDGVSAQMISVHSASGSVSAISTTSEGEMSVHANSGSLRIEAAIARAAQFGTSSGSMRLKRCALETLSATSTSGGLRADELTVEHNVRLETNSGGIKLGRFEAGEMHIEQTSGSLELGEVRVQGAFESTGNSGGFRATRVDARSISVHRSSGSIHATALSAALTLDMHASSGSVHVEQVAAGELRVQTSSGSVKLGSVSADEISANASSGSITIRADKAANTGLNSSSGSVELSLPRDSSIAYELETSSGGINVDPTFEPGARESKKYLSGSVRGGEHAVHIKTSSGGIKLLAR